ncbi:MAG: hypothetical protein Q8Q29_04970, partial [Actinomycetota bacterium]|nr:hypothetical protein [Actinomycetota bacterium]
GVVVAACGDTPATTGTTSTSAPAIATTSPGGHGEAGRDEAGRSLQSAIAAVGDDYGFSSTVTVDGVQISGIEGAVQGDTGSYVVESGGATLEYIVSPSGRWVRAPGADWVRLQGAVPVRAPLSLLAAPKSVEMVAQPEQDTIVRATYDAASLGFAGEEIEVRITIRGGILFSLEYGVAIGEGSASVVTLITPDTSAAPIELPDA